MVSQWTEEWSYIKTKHLIKLTANTLQLIIFKRKMKLSSALPYYFSLTVKHCASACLLFAFKAAMGQIWCAKTGIMKHLVVWNVNVRYHIANSENNFETSNKLGLWRLKKISFLSHFLQQENYKMHIMYLKFSECFYEFTNLSTHIRK